MATANPYEFSPSRFVSLSPIQLSLYTWIVNAILRGFYKNWFEGMRPEEVFIFIEEAFSFPNGKSGRFDLLLLARTGNVATELVVEADGIAYHSSPNQMGWDRERDRLCQQHGMTVARYTGPQINSEPDGCAFEVMSMLYEKHAEDVRIARMECALECCEVIHRKTFLIQ